MVLQNPSNIHYDTPGTYNVSLTASNGITSGTKTKTGFINVGLSPVVNLGNDTSLCAWNTILLDAGNPGGTWLWSTGATTQTILADSSGIGYGSRNFWVKVTNSTGCETMDTIRITFQICDGIEEVGVHPTVTVFPNPSDGHFMIDICGFEGGSWQLYSMDGSLVKQSGISLNKFISAVNVSEIRKGIYLLKVQKGDTILLKKIILQKPMP